MQEEEFITPRILRCVEQPNHEEGAALAGITWLYDSFAYLSLPFSLQLQSGFPETWLARTSSAEGSLTSTFSVLVKDFQGRHS